MKQKNVHKDLLVVISMDKIQVFNINENINLDLDKAINILLVNEDNLNITIDIKTEVDGINIVLIDFAKNNNIKINQAIDQAIKVEFFAILIGTGTNIYEINNNLNVTNSESNVNVIACSNDANISANVMISNNESKTTGNIIMRGVSNKGTVILNPVGKINKNCNLSQNFQESRVLLLDSNQKAEANPVLLIDNFDVQAGHAASVSKIDPNTLFYLTSRGISKNDAEKILMLSFVNPVLKSLPEVIKEPICEYVENYILSL